MKRAHLEDFHEPCDIEFSVQGKVVNVCYEVCDLFFKVMEMFFDIFKGAFVAVVNYSVVVVI